MPVTKKTDSLSIVAYEGDAKVLLAFDVPDAATRRLAGFTIEARPGGAQPYYLQNTLRFEHPDRHAQDAAEPPTSSLNAPFHKFRWLHVPGSFHQGLKPFLGRYTYVVTPRYFDTHGSLQPLDKALSVSLDVDVVPFRSPLLELGFTRGYTQSQAFVNHFGLKALIRPKDDELLFDTSQVAGTNAAGEQFTYADEYEWLGFTAREKVFSLLENVRANPKLRLDMFAYDLNEPDVLRILLELAAQGRVRIVLDDAALHHSAKGTAAEDRFEARFRGVATPPAEIRRGHFGRYAHDKVLIVSDDSGPKTVLTGSTNFSVTGLYVNSNHVLVFTGFGIPEKYAALFEAVWTGDADLNTYLDSSLAQETFDVPGVASPLKITFAPHSEAFASKILRGIVRRVEKEATRRRYGNVLFAVMQLDGTLNPVYNALNRIHADDRLFSFGISDSPGGIALYRPGRKTGVLVTGKPVRTQLPPPFNQVRNVGLGHQIHHKFVVCGFNGDDPVVYCGSSNLAPGGEHLNGDNLLEIHDPDVVTAFAIEALALVDHFQFLNRAARGRGTKSRTAPPSPSKEHTAASAGWFLSTSDRWAKPYFNRRDLHSLDRRLFAQPL